MGRTGNNQLGLYELQKNANLDFTGAEKDGNIFLCKPMWLSIWDTKQSTFAISDAIKSVKLSDACLQQMGDHNNSGMANVFTMLAGSIGENDIHALKKEKQSAETGIDTLC
jgi:hypothetical protein